MNEINDTNILSTENPAVQPDSPYESEAVEQSQPDVSYGGGAEEQTQPDAFGAQPAPQGQPSSPYGTQPVPPMPQDQAGTPYGSQQVPPTPQAQPVFPYGSQPMPQSQPVTLYKTQPVPQSQPGSPYGTQPGALYGTQPPMQSQPGLAYGSQKKPKKDSIAYGVTSLVLGIVSVFLFACCINYITAIIAIVFGILQLVKCKKKGMAITGLVTSGISIILSIVLWVGVVIAVGREQNYSDFGIPNINDYDNYEEYYKDYLDDLFNDTLDNMPSGIEEL